MQFSISGKFQQNEQYISRHHESAFTRWVQPKLKSLFQNPLTFIILVWALMFLFAGVYFVSAQEPAHQAAARHTMLPSRTTTKSRAVAKKRTAERKTETVEIFGVGPESFGPISLPTPPPEPPVAGPPDSQREKLIE